MTKWMVLPFLISSVELYAATCDSLFDGQERRKLHSSASIELCPLTSNKPVLIINTASHCGFTPHFKTLEAIHEQYQAQGLVVIGVPSDDFWQEEDKEKDTAEVCYINYGVTFTMLATSSVRGDDADPIFKQLAQRSGSAPKWNFYKYLVDTDGTVQVFPPTTAPESEEFQQAIIKLLK
ncbi:glutathione peroxidase [Corallincola spongiicola]|uniref:Glutathione peroxidase n=1 Tax=Corallincola spongiicola TaxID=2520508 RepID=A0ABY1WSI7_9GAMM|nr:glutathione peroxidase [Corallincola spongiicola]TAA47711.1 glutathione peroxidase [Corallincola spongiicola]